MNCCFCGAKVGRNSRSKTSWRCRACGCRGVKHLMDDFMMGPTDYWEHKYGNMDRIGHVPSGTLFVPPGMEEPG